MLGHTGFTIPKSSCIRENQLQCSLPSLNLLNFILRNASSGQLTCTDRNFVVSFRIFSFTRSSCPRCPIDGKNIARYTSFHDKCCEREVLNLQCCCRYEDRECDWLGNFRQLQVNSLLPALSGEGRRKVSNCSLT